MQVRSDKLDMTKAKFSPSRYFDTPWQVVAHEQLTHRDKIEILTQWELDAKRGDVATDEGMPGGSDTLLPDIDRALKLLNNRSRACNRARLTARSLP